MTGTAFDAFPITVSSVAFFAAGSAYWNGTDWSGGQPTWYTATGTATWIFPWADASINLNDFDSYRIQVYAKARDAAGNYTTIGPTTIFRVNNSSPTADFTTPAPSESTIWVNSLPALHGISQASTNNFLQYLRLRIKRWKDNQYWGGVTWRRDQRPRTKMTGARTSTLPTRAPRMRNWTGATTPRSTGPPGIPVPRSADRRLRLRSPALTWPETSPIPSLAMNSRGRPWEPASRLPTMC